MALCHSNSAKEYTICITFLSKEQWACLSRLGEGAVGFFFFKVVGHFQLSDTCPDQREITHLSMGARPLQGSKPSRFHLWEKEDPREKILLSRKEKRGRSQHPDSQTGCRRESRVQAKCPCQKPKPCQKRSPGLPVPRYKMEEGMGVGTFLQTPTT